MPSIKDNPECRDFKFDFGIPVKATVHLHTQHTEDGKPYRLELDAANGPALFTYEEFIRFAQSIATLMKPSVLLEN